MKTDMAKESRSICRRFCGALKAFAIGAAIALTGAAWGATQKIGTQTWTYDLVIEGGNTIVAKVASVSPASESHLTIPSSLGGYPVRIIGNEAFRSQHWTGVTIPNTVTNIEMRAFYACGWLQGTLTIPGSVVRIGTSAFAGCNGITSLSIKDGVKTIGGEAFRACSSLTRVTIPDSVTTLGWNAFMSCTDLKKADVLGATFDGKLDKEVDRDEVFNNCAPGFMLVFRETVGDITFYYTVNSSSKATIENGGERAMKPMAAASVAVPAKLGGHDVISIGSSAFEYCSMTSLSLPSGLMAIGEYAFLSCKNLAAVSFPDSLLMIGKGAFYDCDGLTSVNLNKAGVILGDNAFAQCDKIKTVKFPDAVVAAGLGTGVFSSCASLESATMPASALSAISEKQVFKNCPSTAKLSYVGKTTVDGVEMAYVYIDGEGLQIGNGTSCAIDATKTGSVTIPSMIEIGGGSYPVKKIAAHAFHQCKMSSVTIPSSVTAVDWEAFSSSSITSVTVPSSVRTLGAGVFENCKSLKTVTLGSGISSIPTRAFRYCDKLASVSYINNANAVTSIGDNAFDGCASLTRFTTTRSFTSLGNGAFKNCTSLEFITLPYDVFYPELYTNSELRSNIFANCQLLEISFLPSDSSSPERVSLIGGTYKAWTVWAYSVVNNTARLGCTPPTIPCTLPKATGGLFTIPERLGGYLVTEIGEAAFKGCTGLTGIMVPDAVTRIGPNAFEECTALLGVKLPANLTTIDDSAFKGCTAFTVVNVPDKVTSVAANAFSGCSNLTKVTLPKSMWHSASFTGCPANMATAYRWDDGAYREWVNGAGWTYMVSGNEATVTGGSSVVFDATMPSKLGGYSVTAIADDAFSDNSSTKSMLRTIALPDTLKTIGANAFKDCVKLESITLPDSVTSIGAGVFSGCSAMEAATLNGNITAIPANAFKDCSSLEGVYANYNVVSIGDSAFSGCSSLQWTFPNLTTAKIVSIGKYAFAGCTSDFFNDIILDDSVTTIGDYAFINCNYNLRAISLPGSLSGVIDESKVFRDCYNISVTYRFADGSRSETINGVTYRYKIESGKATIVGATFTGNTVSIPASIAGYAVTSIANFAFKDKTSLTYLTIPDSVTFIGEGAFSGCTSLSRTGISATSNLQTVRANAYSRCSLTTVTLPDSVTRIDGGAFMQNANLNRASLPGSFYNNLNVGSVFADTASDLVITYRLDEGDVMAQKVGDCTWYFKEGESASTVTITDVDKPSIVSVVNIPAKLGGKTVGTIGGYVFDQMSDVTSITIPNGVTTIESYAFYKCTGLTSIEIPRSVTSLKNNAFTGCSNLTSASLPDTLNYIDETAVFPNCPASLVINFRDKSGRLNYTSGGKTWWYRIVDGGAELYYSDDYSASHQAVSPKPTGALVIPDTINSYPVTKIGKYAFYDYGDMTSVSIPATVREIDENAFWLCSSLTTVNFASGSALSTIGKNAFRQSGLTGIVLPDSVTSIGTLAFHQCSALTSVTIPEGVVEIKEGAFSYTPIEQVTIPESVASLGPSAFSYCTNMTSAVIPASLTDVGYGAFNGCKKLEDVALGSQAIINKFRDVFDLRMVKHVTIQSGVKDIPQGAFYDPMGSSYGSGDAVLESVDLPDTLETFYFYSCPELQSLDIPEGVKSGKAENCGLTQLSIPASLALDENSSFSGLSKLQELVLAEGIKTIGDNMFKNAFDLPSLVIPDGVTSIGARAFYRAESLATLTIPRSVESIGESAFASAGIATVHVAARDTDRVKAMLVASGLEESFVNGLTFVEALPDFWFITFNGNGGTASASVYERAPNANLGTLPTAERANHSFLGWFTEAEGGTKIGPTKRVTGDVTYYAHWKHNQHTVTIDTGTGSTTSVPIDHGTTIGDVLLTITQPTREGYTFKGWVDADDEPLDLLAPVTADTTFIAVWAKNVVVDCYAVLDGELQPKSAWYLGVDGVEGDVLDVGSQFIDGYVFQGWSTEPDGELLTGTIIAAEGLTLYAQFTLDAWTVTFDPNGGECDTISVKVAKGENLDSLPEATKAGYNFGGWWTGIDGGTQISAGAGIDGDNTLYARWRHAATVDGYTYEYDIQDGKAVIHERDGGVAVEPAPAGKLVIPAVLNGIPVNKIGLGAFSNLPDIEEVVISEGIAEIGQAAFYGDTKLTTVTIPKSVTAIADASVFYSCPIYTINVAYGDAERVKALFTSIGYDLTYLNFVEAEAPKFTVTLDPNGGSVDPTSVDVAEGAKVSALLPTPAYPGFSFTGWFTAAEGGEKVTAETTATADVTYFAQWTALTAYTVTLDANGGTVALDNILVYAGEKIGDLPTPEKEGFRFTAWKQGSTTVTKDTVVNADMTIVAQWEEIYVASEFTVTFDVNGGTLASGSASITVTEGQKVGTKLPSATRTGYEFTGWKVSDLLWVDAETVVTENLNCTAQWQPNTYAVTYNANGGTIGGVESMTTDVFYDGAYSLPTPDERVGWTFAGWFTKATGGDQVNDGDTVTITAAQTLYAHWTKVAVPKYTVTFNANGGSVSPASVQVDEGSAIGTAIAALPTPTWDADHEFLGWYLGVDPATTATIVTSDIELVALWQEVTVGGGTWTDTDTGLTWDYKLTADGEGIELYKTDGWFSVTPKPTGVVTVPATIDGKPVTVIGREAFGGCDELTSVVLPDTVTEIGEWAFDQAGITGIEFPEGLKTIGDYAFYGCSGLTSIVIPSGVTSIGAGAFMNNVNLAEVTIPSSVTSIGADAFSSAPITTLHVEEGTSADVLQLIADSGFDTTQITDVKEDIGGGELVQYAVTLNANGGTFPPSTATTWLMSAYYGKAYGTIEKLRTPSRDGYTFAGWFTAAEGGDLVTDATIMTREEAHTLYAQWTEKAGVTLTLELNGGSGCETAITYEAGDQVGILPIPEGPEYMDRFLGWFWDADGYDAVKPTDIMTTDRICYAKWEGSLPLQSAMVDGVEWTYYVAGSMAVIYNNGRTAVPADFEGVLIIPAKLGGKTVGMIGARSFYGMAGLTSVIIPDGVTSISQSAFAWCENLKVVQFGKNMVQGKGMIDVNAFQGCVSLEVLDFKAAKPPTAYPGAFENAGYATGRGRPWVYVPKTAKQADWGFYWNEMYVNFYSYNARIGVEFKHPEQMNVAGKISYSGGWEIGKTLTLKATASKGYVFAGWWDKDTGERCSRAVSYSYFVSGLDRNFLADFVTEYVDTVLKVTLEDCSTAGNGWIMIDLGAATESYSDPKFTVKGLPSGLKYDSKTQKISGTATKPGKYKVTVTATNTTVKKPTPVSTAEFTLTVPNFTDDEIPVADEYGPFIPGVAVGPVTVSEAAGCKVTGLPSGMKWTEKPVTDKTLGVIPAYSFYGTPTKPGNYTVYFTKTTADKVKHTATATFVVDRLRTLTLTKDGATGKDDVKGGGNYEANKKVSLKATADKGKVFSGWYDSSTGYLIDRAANYSYVMPAEDTTLTGVFITEFEDRQHLDVTIGGIASFDQNKAGAEPNAVWNQTTVEQGVYVEWPVDPGTWSFATIKVSGLPAGLKFTAKDVVDSKTKAVIVPANTIYGTPTAASKLKKGSVDQYDPSVVKITVTTAGKVTANYQLDVYVTALRPWAVGTFDGGGDYGQVTLTVANSGKISGKYLAGGSTLTLASDGFLMFDATPGNETYVALLTGKVGKEVLQLAFYLSSNTIGEISGVDEIAGTGMIVDGDDAVLAMLVQTKWKAEPWKTIAKAFASAPELTYLPAGYSPTAASIALKFARSGAVTAKGTLSGYKASGSATIIPYELVGTDGSFNALVYVYFPPKAGKFNGYIECKEIRWNASTGSFQLIPAP